MSKVRAFVGHSFSKADSHVVSTFLNYLSRLRDLQKDFSWLHAEDPEPEIVSAKVLALFEGVNAFIGICTRKERVISEESLRPSRLNRNVLSFDVSQAVWKASDWVIQEIGVAIGMKLKVILLIEEGVRPPGSLQGNLEYIPFERDHPEKAFDKLAAMVSKLCTPDEAKPLAEPAVEASTEPSSPLREPTKDATAWEDPSSSWDIGKYRSAVIDIAIKGDLENLTKLRQSLINSTLGDSADALAKFDMWVEYCKLAWGVGGDLDKMENIAERNLDVPEFSTYLGTTYEAAMEYSKAARIFRRGADAAPDEENRAYLLGRHALALIADDPSISLAAVQEEMRSAAAADALALPNVLTAIKDIEDKIGNKRFQIAAMEFFLDLRPQDESVRYELAYLYSQVDSTEMSYYHYHRIQNSSRGVAAWNNIGVALDAMKAPIESVRAYLKASEKFDPYSLSNLAYKYLNAGFFDQAKTLLDSSVAKGNANKNVEAAIVALRESKEREDLLIKNSLESSRKTSEFRKAVGRALAANSPADFGAVWVATDARLSVLTDGQRITAQGSYVRRGILSNLIGNAGSTEEWEVEYVGTSTGCAIQGKLVRRRKGEQLTVLGATTPVDFLMWYSPEQHKIFVSEGEDDKRYTMLVQ